MDKTPRELVGELKNRLADGYLKNPHVTVVVKEQATRKIFVLGEVARPGTLPYENGMTIIQAISTAGGFTKLAAGNRVGVTRMDANNKEQKFTVPVTDIGNGEAPNFELFPGDIIFVPESLF
jgi:polysaccharide export outer membrane protein